MLGNSVYFVFHCSRHFQPKKW